MSTSLSSAPCTTGCHTLVRERNRYFTGKYMTARDFQGEQDYFLSRYQLHNRLFHGWGVVCGLKVIPHHDPHCAANWVIVCPGVALDCCGRELVIDRKTPVKIWDPPPPVTDEVAQPPDHPAEPPGAFLLYLRRSEELIENVPVLYAEGNCDATRQEANRVREITCLEAIPWTEELQAESGWRIPNGVATGCCDDCADALPGPAGACLEPKCPRWSMVPLALITPHAKMLGYPTKVIDYLIGKEEIDITGQRHLPQPASALTHITHINWQHGGTVKLSELREQPNPNDPHDRRMGGQLKIYFDRKLEPKPKPKSAEPTDPDLPENTGTGISRYTFVVEYGGAQKDVEFLGDEQAPPTLDEEGCVAIFTIDPDLLKRRGNNIAGNTIFVTLKCDFILDCHGNPVDGEHLGGCLPSGNGQPGGSFESWFRVEQG